MNGHSSSPPCKDTNNNMFRHLSPAPSNQVNHQATPNFLCANTSEIIDSCSLISEAKPAAILVNECGEIDAQINKNHEYFLAYELIFHERDIADSDYASHTTSLYEHRPYDESVDRLCCFAGHPDGSLFLATQCGTIGTINTHKCMTAWISIMRTEPSNRHAECTQDFLYQTGAKRLVDLCISGNQIVLLTKVSASPHNDTAEFKIEVYNYLSDSNQMSLVRHHNLTKSIVSFQSQPCEFVRIYWDESEKGFVIIDSNNHKVYWINSDTCQAKRCVKSPDCESIQYPSSLLLLADLKSIYICSKKGMVIFRPEQQSVKHDSIIPVDISHCKEDDSIYLIDEFTLYRTKINKSNNDDHVAHRNEQRFKRIFSNRKQEKRGFKRVLVFNNNIFIMSSDRNSFFVIERESLKLKV